MQVELNPHTFAERIRGEFDGPPVRPRTERGLRGNFAWSKPGRAIRWGNLIYRKTARNFNPMMATAAKL